MNIVAYIILAIVIIIAAVLIAMIITSDMSINAKLMLLLLHTYVFIACMVIYSSWINTYDDYLDEHIDIDTDKELDLPGDSTTKNIIVTEVRMKNDNRLTGNNSSSDSRTVPTKRSIAINLAHNH